MVASVGTKFNGATVRPSKTTVSRRKEAPYLVKLLKAKTRDEAIAAVNSGRSFSDRRREDTLDSIRGKK